MEELLRLNKLLVDKNIPKTDNNQEVRKCKSKEMRTIKERETMEVKRGLAMKNI
jgi:hypothetical protein